MASVSASSLISPTATASSTSTGTIATSGLVSGLDSKAIIEGLVALDQSKITRLELRKATVTAQRSALQGIETRLLALQGQITQFSRSQNGIFASRKATSSATDIVSAAASSSAVAGAYRLRVNSLAKAQQIASQGFDSLTSAVTRGTFQLAVGGASTSITIDSTNDTLQGLASAINNSGAAVTAAIVNDGFGEGRQGYRLLITSNNTGTANAIAVTNQLAGSAGAATKPVFDAASIGSVLAASSNASTALAQSNAGAGYTGTSNNVYTFRVVTGGTVGTDSGIQLSYTDATGANTGVITLDPGDVDVLKTAAQGIGIKFAAGTLVAGDSFQVKAFVPEVQDAADASLTLGSGAGSLIVTNSSNQIDTLIPGVTLQLGSADPTKDVVITIANDTEKIKKSIEDFVAAYNDFIGFTDQQTSFSATTSIAGPLLGNAVALSVQSRVRTAITSAVPGLKPVASHLGSLGITTNRNGQLQINDAKLSAALSGGVAGVTFDDLSKLFALSGSTDNSNVQFVTGSAKTVATSTPYTVRITQSAERATLTAASPLAATTTIDGTNNTFIVSIDGKTSTPLTLAAGTYSQAALAQAVQSAITGNSSLSNTQVSVTVANNQLSITSQRYGAASNVTVQSGTALASLGFTAGAASQGRDVAGSFLVGGVVETAVGTGQFLVGDSANANTSGLQLRVQLTAAQVGTETQANVTVSRGIASLLDRELTNLFDPFNGRLKTADDDFDARLQQIADQVQRENDRIAAKRDQLTTRFTAMERALGQLQSTSNYLAQQLAATLSTSSK